MQVFEERLQEFLAEDFRKFSVEVDKGAAAKIGEILAVVSLKTDYVIAMENGSFIGNILENRL